MQAISNTISKAMAEAFKEMYQNTMKSAIKNLSEKLSKKMKETDKAPSSKEIVNIWNDMMEDEDLKLTAVSTSKEVKEKKDKKEKKKKDPNAPKKNMTAYILFSNDKRPEVKEENPDLKFGDVAKELGRLWKDASSSTKKKYEKLAEKEKERYTSEMADYSPDEESEEKPKTKKKKDSEETEKPKSKKSKKDTEDNETEEENPKSKKSKKDTEEEKPKKSDKEEKVKIKAKKYTKAQIKENNAFDGLCWIQDGETKYVVDKKTCIGKEADGEIISLDDSETNRLETHFKLAYKPKETSEKEADVEEDDVEDDE